MRILILILIWWSGPSWSDDELELFTESGRAIQSYDRVVKEISKGSTVLYPDKSKFTIIERLEGGGTNKIFRARLISTGEFGILRIPVEIDALHFASETLNGYELLNQEGIRIPELIRGVKGQYVFQKEEPVELTAIDLLEGNLKNSKFSEAELFQKLVLLFEKTARFRRLDDVTPQNVYFDGVEWGVLDWQGKHALIDGRRLKTVLDSWLGEKNERAAVKKFWIEAKEAIQKTRAANPHWLEPGCENSFRNVLEN